MVPAAATFAEARWLGASPCGRTISAESKKSGVGLG